MNQQSFQELMAGSHCWGCSPTNEQGLQIKSYWSGDESVCTWEPSAHHSAWNTNVLNGGIISALIDCHSICTAFAEAYKLEGRDIGTGEGLYYATGSLSVRFLKPTPLERPVLLTARVTDRTERRINLACSLTSDGVECATGEVIAVKVPSELFNTS